MKNFNKLVKLHNALQAEIKNVETFLSSYLNKDDFSVEYHPSDSCYNVCHERCETSGAPMTIPLHTVFNAISKGIELNEKYLNSIAI